VLPVAPVGVTVLDGPEGPVGAVVEFADVGSVDVPSVESVVVELPGWSSHADKDNATRAIAGASEGRWSVKSVRRAGFFKTNSMSWERLRSQVK